MMKRKILAVTIPVVGCITVVGSGFSAWYFNAATSAGDDNKFALNTHVTEKVNDMTGALRFEDSNNLALNNKYLILDQGGMNNDNELVGIMIADTTVNETVKNTRNYTFKVVFDGNSSSLTLNKIYDAHMALSVTVDIDLSNKLFQYVTLVDKEPNKASMTVSYTPTSGSTSDTVYFSDTDGDHIWTATYTLTAGKLPNLADGDISYFEWTFDINLSTNDRLENSLFRYVDDKKPTNGDKYDEMVKALGLEVGGKPGTLGFATTAKIGAAA